MDRPPFDPAAPISARFGFGFVMLVVAAIVILLNFSLSPLPFNINDLHLMWVLGGDDVFVKTSRGGANDTMTTHIELMRQDNPQVTFQREKAPGVFRVFCIGGSTTRGWPFQSTAAYPKLLSELLADLLPGKKLEIINAGICASDSSTDLRLVRQLMSFDPDLLLIYEGRNEAWNLALHLGFRAWLIKAHFWLIRNIRLLYRLHKLVFHENQEMNQGLAIRIWAERSRQSVNEGLYTLLRSNLGSMLNEIRKRHCGVVLLTQVISPEERQENPVIFKINTCLRGFSTKNQVALIDLDETFRQRWDRHEDYIIPYPLTHPDLMGYMLFAKTVALGLASRGFIAPRESWQWDRLESDAAYLKKTGITTAYLAEKYRMLGRECAQIGKSPIAKMYFQRAERVATRSCAQV